MRKEEELLYIAPQCRVRIKEGNSVGAETRLAGHLTGGEWGRPGRASPGGALQTGHLENQEKIE